MQYCLRSESIQYMSSLERADGPCTQTDKYIHVPVGPLTARGREIMKSNPSLRDPSVCIIRTSFVPTITAVFIRPHGNSQPNS